jgi:hypothetical protein
MCSKLRAESVLLEYVERYGLTESARRYFQEAAGSPCAQAENSLTVSGAIGMITPISPDAPPPD